jgi:hypothetical protein
MPKVARPSLRVLNTPRRGPRSWKSTWAVFGPKARAVLNFTEWLAVEIERIKPRCGHTGNPSPHFFSPPPLSRNQE